jgi:transmembrane sensor
MKDYSHYTALELAQDEAFAAWVKGPNNEQLDEQWNAWLQKNPEKQEIVTEARCLILAVVSEKQYVLSEFQQDDLWSRIDDTIEASEFIQPEEKKFSFAWYSMAAAISAIIIAGIWYFTNRNDLQFSSASQTASTEEAQLLKFTNEGNKVHVILLEDGSTISLEPHSTLEYPEKFSDTKREVYLYGEAFFQIARDPKKPFSVHTNDLVTQVLGTSFRIRAFAKEKNIIVAVKTGKVSVFTESSQSGNHASAAILTPNQQVVFSKEESRMVKSLVEDPTVVPHAVEQKSFDFKDAPIAKVFATLEEAYGVDIVFDEEVMSNCYLNASLDDVPFYDQLRLICKGINAKYEVMDAHIIITGNGCN